MLTSLYGQIYVVLLWIIIFPKHAVSTILYLNNLQKKEQKTMATPFLWVVTHFLWVTNCPSVITEISLHECFIYGVAVLQVHPVDAGVSQQYANAASSVLYKVELPSATNPSPIIIGTGRGSYENGDSSYKKWSNYENMCHLFPFWQFTYRDL